jgi:hypothetical protein
MVVLANAGCYTEYINKEFHQWLLLDPKPTIPLPSPNKDKKDGKGNATSSSFSSSSAPIPSWITELDACQVVLGKDKDLNCTPTCDLFVMSSKYKTKSSKPHLFAKGQLPKWLSC